jgi:hypothetical protein
MFVGVLPKLRACADGSVARGHREDAVDDVLCLV